MKIELPNIQVAREWIFDSSPTIDRLQSLEKSFPLLPHSVPLTQCATLLNALRDCNQERTHRIFGSVHKHEKPVGVLKAFEKIRVSLVQLQKKLETGDIKEIEKAFNAVPLAYQTFLLEAVSLKKGSTSEKNSLSAEDIPVLNCNEPLIHIKGSTLVEQLINKIDDYLIQDTQLLTVRKLKNIKSLLEKPDLYRSQIIECIEDLPLPLQWALHEAVYYSSPDRNDEFEWGKRKLYSDPTALLYLVHPHSEASDLISHFIQKEEASLENIRTCRNLESFERLSVLYRVCPPEQYAVLVKQVAPTVQKWLEAAQKAEIERSKDPSFDALYKHRGAHFADGITSFSVYAPHAKEVVLSLSSDGEESHRIEMRKNLAGVWECSTKHAPPGTSYRYHVKDVKGDWGYRTDPFSFSMTRTDKKFESVVAAPESFEWSDSSWITKRSESDPLKKPLSIYELYPQCWKTKDGEPLSFRELAPELVKYCKEMNFTHVELYSVLDNYGGWGYQVLNFFAPYHRMGTAEDFQYLVDQLHQNDIGIILDWIPAHYQHEYWTEATMHSFDGTDHLSAGPSEWGTAFFDYSKKETRRFLEASLQYWINVMHVDMVRWDAVSHIARRDGRDYGPGIDFIKAMNTQVHRDHPGVLMIAEDPTYFPAMTKPVEEGGLGFDLEWWIHEGKNMRYFIETPMEERVAHHGSKFMDHLRWVKLKERGIMTHSHDEQANRDVGGGLPEYSDATLRNIGKGRDAAENFADMRNFFAWQSLSPTRGYLLHMGDEIGQRRSWNTLIDAPEGAIDWSLVEEETEENRLNRGLQKCISDLNGIYRTYPSFWLEGEQGFTLCCDHSANNVIAYERAVEGETPLLTVHNFSTGQWAEYDIQLGDGKFSTDLTELEEIFNSNDISYGGTGEFVKSEIKINRDAAGKAISITISLPPLSTILFKKVEAETMRMPDREPIVKADVLANSAN